MGVSGRASPRGGAEAPGIVTAWAESAGAGFRRRRSAPENRSRQGKQGIKHGPEGRRPTDVAWRECGQGPVDGGASRKIDMFARPSEDATVSPPLS